MLEQLEVHTQKREEGKGGGGEMKKRKRNLT